MSLNAIQRAAFSLIQSDARFIYTLIDIQKNAHNINSNYVMMCQPYIGIFADGAEQWSQKVGLNAPLFTGTEKAYYAALRQGHKLLAQPYDAYSRILMEKFIESDNYFYRNRRLREKVLGYYNVGTDLCHGEYCGNTIICALHTPMATLGNSDIGVLIKDISIVVGKLAAFYICTNSTPYRYDDSMTVRYKDYHFFNDCPLKMKTSLGLVLFSILCNINYVTGFINTYFLDEIPQKLKFAYLQYYYLCDFIHDLNQANGTHFSINTSLKNKSFRNCLAHYGLGQLMTEHNIIEDDYLKGLTNKVFNTDYVSTKRLIYKYLDELCVQIKKAVLNT